MDVLFEDNCILIVKKEAGESVVRDKLGQGDLETDLSLRNGGFIGVVHRLDKPVSGVMVFAKTREALASLSSQIQTGKFKKTYCAAVCGATKDFDTLTHYLVKNERLNVSKSVHKNEKGAKEAVLSYSRLDEKMTEFGIISLLEIDLKTGRHHQIRVQMKSEGFPIFGDTKYNERFKNPETFINIALSSYKIGFFHPKTNKFCEFACERLNFPV